MENNLKMLITHLFHFTVVFNLSTSAKVTPVLAQSSVKSFITVPVMFSIKSYSPVPQPHFTPTIGSLWFSSISWTSFDADKRRKIIFFHGCIIVNLKITFNFYYVLGAGSVFISWLSLSHWIPLPILHRRVVMVPIWKMIKLKPRKMK